VPPLAAELEVEGARVEKRAEVGMRMVVEGISPLIPLLVLVLVLALALLLLPDLRKAPRAALGEEITEAGPREERQNAPLAPPLLLEPTPLVTAPTL
jgi:hypothetical protein